MTWRSGIGFMMRNNGRQYGKWLITGYKHIKLHHRLSEAETLNNHRTSHLLYCVLWAAVLFKIDIALDGLCKIHK